MADLYSVILGIEPDQQDVVEAELLARQILEAQYPDLDLREGTGIRDLVIRPSAFILAICKKAFDYYFTQNTLAGVTDATPPEMVDAILGNLFLTRNTGTYAVINARLYFARQKSVAIPAATSFSTDGSLLFYPGSVISITDTAMLYDSYQNEWYYDVNLVAAQTGAQYNLASGSLLYFSNFDPFFLHAEINYLATSSTASETNTQFIARAGSSISTRNLINIPSIASNLQQNFNYLDQLLTIGSGSGQLSMHRDQIFVNGPRGIAQLSVSSAYSAGNLNLRLNLSANGFIIGQLLDLTEVGGASWVLRSVPVAVIVDSDTFEVVIPFTFTVHTLGQFWITTVEPDLWLHQGGCVDVYVGNTVQLSEQQYTLDANGTLSLYGPNYFINRINGLTDTLPTGLSYTLTFPGTTSRGDVLFVQNGTTGVLTCTMVAHCMTVGRLVKINEWPAPGSTLYLPVHSIINGDKFTLGENLPIYTVVPGAVSLSYVQPDQDFGFSTRQILTIGFGIAHANQTVTFDVFSFDKVESVQNYLASDNNRVICADLMARGFDIYSIDLQLTFYTTLVPSSAEVSTILTPMLAAIPPGTDLLLSDVTAALVSAGMTSLQNPIQASTQLYTKDMWGPQVYVFTDYIKPINNTCVYRFNSVTITSATD